MDLATHAEAIAALYQPPETGRPSDISDAEKLKELFAAIEAGNYLETACELAGLSSMTVRNWVKRGDADEEPYKRFVATLKRASARAEALAVANVRQAGKLPQFWAAEMTYLERRHPERWGRRNEGSNEPRVVVQIGVKDSDVQVQIQTQPGSESPLSPAAFALDAGRNHDANSLQPQTFALPVRLINSDYSNQPQRDPPANQGARSPEGPTRSPARLTPRRGSSVKSVMGRAKEKKAGA